MSIKPFAPREEIKNFLDKHEIRNNAARPDANFLVLYAEKINEIALRWQSHNRFLKNSVHRVILEIEAIRSKIRSDLNETDNKSYAIVWLKIYQQLQSIWGNFINAYDIEIREI
ncbi:hypothetical protein R1T16_05610 [Flavobacterium sp. DG1-102-2]|uniref:hypothetical protein n=1 Tax=Flavobacterium sp. DG1-102-2 TaxID=3081663 RepID=UPI002949EB43|nr:hypothetical protein [Flavobacterium sp. DG1-102-2]MDV6167892.1 hypothetical protein [Flavobacterium sp. DG1-102-2]